MHHPTDRIIHTTAFATPVVEHWLERDFFFKIFFNSKRHFILLLLIEVQGLAQTQAPTLKHYVLELPTFGAITGVSPTRVQWEGLTLGGPPGRSW